MNHLLAWLRTEAVTPLGQIIKRILISGAVAFAVTFSSLATGSGLFNLAHVVDMSIWQKVLGGAIGAGLAAVLAGIQSALSQWLAGTPRLLPLLALTTRRGRCEAREHRSARHIGVVLALLPRRRRFGKLPAAPLVGSVRLDHHVDTTVLPAPPTTLNWATRIVVAWGMMLNDRLGDCTCAAVGHAIQLMTGIARGAARTLTDAQILALYEKVSGYNPATGANDNGAQEVTVLERWRRCGVAGDKITAHGRIDHSNVPLVQQIIGLLGFVYIGTAVPAAWEQAPAVWDVPTDPTQAQIVGGHAVILVGWDTEGFWLISWGQLFKMTYAAFAKYVDEVHGVIDTDWLNASGISPTGIDLAGLLSDLDAHDTPDVAA